MSIIKAIGKTKKYEIRTGFEIAAGGEGTIYEIDSNTVAKIYHDGITPIGLNKFKFLSGLDKDYFVSPIELLYNTKGIVIGYTMKYVDQSFSPLSNIYNKKFCKNNLITSSVKMKILKKLISAVKYAHKENVVIGDLNPFNILVNNKGVVKFIDTDSYETPGSPHSMILLDEIRDYYYQGRVSKNSDFFALSILAFNMISFLHPFKGMHSKFKKIGDRMIHKLPVFANNTDIKTPKCYEPIKDKFFLNQFKRLYLNGERFILSISGVDNSIIATSPLRKPTLVKKYENDELIITMINQDSEVININFLDKQGVVETDSEYIIYDTRNKGYVSLKYRINKSECDKVFIGNKNVLLKNGNELLLYNKDGSKMIMKNFNFPEKHIISQIGNILIVIGKNDMFKIFLDKVGAGIVVTEHVGVFGKSFNNNNGLIHNSGGKQNIFYNSGKNISIVTSPVSKIKYLYQCKNVGVIQYFDNKKIKTKLFKINGLKAKISKSDIDGVNNFAFIQNEFGNKEEGIVFYPIDGGIDIYRSDDFEKIGYMKCNLISSQSVLQKSNSGILFWEDNCVALLNKK